MVGWALVAPLTKARLKHANQGAPCLEVCGELPTGLPGIFVGSPVWPWSIGRAHALRCARAGARGATSPPAEIRLTVYRRHRF